MKKSVATILLITISTAPGCLRTRADLQMGGSQREMNKQALAQAQEQAKIEEQNEQMREMRGRIEVLEHELREATRKKEEVDPSSQKVTELEGKLKYYEEAILKLEKQLEEVQAKQNQPPPAPPAPEAKPKSSFDAADQLFDQKKWREAIIAFQKYRDNNPKGLKYADATYKIGVSFQELGMKVEAKAFFEEVLEKFPKDQVAKKAKFRLSSLK